MMRLAELHHRCAPARNKGSEQVVFCMSVHCACDNMQMIYPGVFEYDSSLLRRIVEPTEHHNIQCSVLETNFDLPGTSMFSPNDGGAAYGTELKLKTGEHMFLRVRSFLNHCEVNGRAFEPMMPGERREVLIVLMHHERPRQCGVFHMLVAYYPSFKDAPNHHNKQQTAGVSSLNVYPLVLANQFFRNTKRQSIQNKLCVFMSSCNVVTSNGIELRKGLHWNTLVQWYANVEKLTYYDPQLMMQMSDRHYENLSSVCYKKLLRHATQEYQHPTVGVAEGNALPPDVSIVRNGRFASLACEQATLASMLDIKTSGALDGIRLPMFEDPSLFPMYLTMCVFFAANPSMYGMCSVTNDDCFAAETVLQEYTSLTTYCRVEQSNMSAAEQCLLQAVDCYKSASKSCTLSNDSVPFSAHHMQRQGIALCIELCSIQSSAEESSENAALIELLGKDVYNTAQEDIGCACTSHVVSRMRNAGVVGGERHDVYRCMRASTQNDLIRELVSTMVKVNDWVSTGIYNMRRISRENTPMETATMGHFWNFEAATTACGSMRRMMESGPLDLVSQASFVCMPTHPDAKVTCGDCSERFSLTDTLARSRIATCGQCDVYFCNCCYERKVCLLSHVSGGNPLSNRFATENKKLWYCKFCASKLK